MKSTQIFFIFLPPFTGQKFVGFPLVGVQRTTAGFTLMTGVQTLHITGFRRGKELAGFIKVRKVVSQTSFSNETTGWYRILVLQWVRSTRFLNDISKMSTFPIGQWSQRPPNSYWRPSMCIVKKKLFLRLNCKKLFFFSPNDYETVWKWSDPDPNWNQFVDPDPNMIYFDPHH